MIGDGIAHQAAAGGQHHRVGARSGAQLVEQALDVGLDSADADAQLARDRLVALALGQQLQHVGLAAGQADAGEAVGHAAAQFRAQVAHAAAQRAHGGQQLLGVGILQQVAVHAGHHGGAHFPFPFQLRDDQHARLLVAMVRVGGAAHVFQAVAVIEDDHVRAGVAGRLAVGNGDLDVVVRAQQRCQAGADDGVCMCHHHAHLFALLDDGVGVTGAADGGLWPGSVIHSHVTLLIRKNW
ncbi:conserved hypothetical protein [Ricinus communis]|uniref:Uncharacterized protein n=1 Tax=Ricinus communis TaxID=3988 RepID=B9THN0_RICCO|nr:conserved hypothetical protein [Ricinus communis]